MSRNTMFSYEQHCKMTHNKESLSQLEFGSSIYSTLSVSCLFNNHASSSDCIASNDRMISEQMNWKGCERKQSWPNLKYNSGICCRNFGMHEVPHSILLVSCLAFSSFLKLEAAKSFEVLVNSYWTT
jgi:hypothetical protein